MATAGRKLQMASGGPRGRSGAGASVEGAGGAKVVIASAMPLQGVRTQERFSADTEEYGDSGTITTLYSAVFWLLGVHAEYVRMYCMTRTVLWS